MQAAHNLDLLARGEELGSVRVIIQIEVGDAGCSQLGNQVEVSGEGVPPTNNNSQNAFEDEDP